MCGTFLLIIIVFGRKSSGDTLCSNAHFHCNFAGIEAKVIFPICRVNLQVEVLTKANTKMRVLILKKCEDVEKNKESNLGNRNVNNSFSSEGM